MSKPKLTYFDFSGGRGEDCRLALHIAGVDFEDHRIKGATWKELKADTPYGSLPVLQVPNKGPLAQSNTILKYIGIRHDLHPEDQFEAARHESFMNAVEDLRSKITPILRVEEDRQKVREEFAADYLQAWGRHMEAQIGDEGPFIAGEKLHVADIKLHGVMTWFAKGGVDHIGPDVFEAFPKMNRVFNAVKQHPKVIDWYAD